MSWRCRTAEMASLSYLFIITTAGVNAQTFTCSDGTTTITCATQGSPGTVTGVSGTALDRSTIDVLWTPPDTSGASIGDTRQYEVLYFAVGEGEGANGTTVFTNITSSNSLQAPPSRAQLTSLNSYSLYNIRVRAYALDSSNVLQAGALTDPFIIRTSAGISSEVRNVNAVAINSTAVNISWTSPASPNGVIQNYTIRQNQFNGSRAYYPQNIDTTIVNIGSTSSTTTHFVHTGLQPYASYTYSVIAFTETGSNFGDDLAVLRTPATIPLYQPAPEAQTTGHSTVKLTWDGPAVPNGEIERMDVVVYSGSSVWGNFSKAPIEFVDVNATSHNFTYTVTGLKSDTQYRFGIVTCVISPYVCGDISPLTTQETLSTTPDTATSLVIAVICIAISLASLGFVWEHERDRQAIKNWHASTLMINSQFQQVDRLQQSPSNSHRISATVLDESDSGSSFDEDEVKKPSLSSLIAASKVTRKFSASRASQQLSPAPPSNDSDTEASKTTITVQHRSNESNGLSGSSKSSSGKSHVAPNGNLTSGVPKAAPSLDPFGSDNEADDESV